MKTEVFPYIKSANKYSKIVTIIFMLLLTALPLSLLSAQSGDWRSLTYRRVNLREGASQSSAIITTLDVLTKVEVIGERPDWLNVRLENGLTGWLSSDFVISRDRLTEIEEIGKDLALETATPPESQAIRPDTEKPEFTTQKEPDVGSAITERAGEQSFLAAHFDEWNLNIFFPLLLGISILANIALFYIAKVARKTPELSGNAAALKRNYDLLKKTSDNQNKQLSFSKEKIQTLEKTIQKNEKERQLQNEMHAKEIGELKTKYNELDKTHAQCSRVIREKDEQITKAFHDNKMLTKEVENIHQKFSKSQDNLQKQAIQLTLAEQKHTESLLHEQGSVKKLEAKIVQLEQQITDDSKKYSENLQQRLKEIEQLKADNNQLQNTVDEQKKSVDNYVAKAVKDKDKELTSKFEKMIDEEKSKHEESLAKLEKSFREKTEITVKEKEQELEKLTVEKLAAEKAGLKKSIEETAKKAADSIRKENEELIRINKEATLEIETLKEQLEHSRKKLSEHEQHLAALGDQAVPAQADVKTNPAYIALEKELNIVKTELDSTKNNLLETEKDWAAEKSALQQTIREYESLVPAIKEEPVPAVTEEPVTVEPETDLGKIPPKEDMQYDDYARSFLQQIRKL